MKKHKSLPMMVFKKNEPTGQVRREWVNGAAIRVKERFYRLVSGHRVATTVAGLNRILGER